MAKMSREEIDSLLENGQPGAVSITQFVDGQLKTWYAPALDDIFISFGELEKFDDRDSATARAIEIKQQAAAKQAAV